MTRAVNLKCRLRGLNYLFPISVYIWQIYASLSLKWDRFKVALILSKANSTI